MSLAVDASSPTAAIGSGATTVTGAFTPPDNTLLVAFCAGDANNGSLDEDQTVVDSTSTTWTKKVLRNGNGGACVTVHYRRLSGTGSSPGSITATLTDTKGSVAKRIFPRVFIDAATGIAPDIGATAVSGSASVSLTTTVNNSWVWSIALTANAVLTAGTGCTQQDDFGGFDSGDAVQTESQTSLTATAGTVVTNGLNGTTTVPHNVAIEIIPGSAGSASQPATPLVVAPARAAAAPSAPILLRGSLTNPPVLTTVQPLVSIAPAPKPPSLTVLFANPAAPPPIAGVQPAIVVTQPPRPPGLTVLLTNPAPPPILAGVQPLVNVIQPPSAPGLTILGRSSLADVVVATTPAPQPVLVLPASAPAAGRTLLFRGSLVDPPTAQPIIAIGPGRSRAGMTVLLSNPAAPVVVTSVTTPQPVIVMAPAARSGALTLILAGSTSVTCDCLVHRPSTGTVTRGSTGTITRPYTGVVTRPCSC